MLEARLTVIANDRMESCADLEETQRRTALTNVR